MKECKEFITAVAGAFEQYNEANKDKKIATFEWFSIIPQLVNVANEGKDMKLMKDEFAKATSEERVELKEYIKNTLNIEGKAQKYINAYLDFVFAGYNVVVLHIQDSKQEKLT